MTTKRHLNNDEAGVDTVANATDEVDEIRLRMGRELKKHRSRKGMSLDNLAEMSGVSRAMISKIERGQSSPSTTILSKLVDALDISVSTLMSRQSERQDIVVIRHPQQHVLTDPVTGFSRRCLSPLLPGRGLDWLLAELPAGSNTGELTAHSLPIEEYIYVLKGSLVVTVADEITTLGASDSMYYRADVPHRFSNVSRASCQYFIVISPLRG
ncbi:helix-turn-helix domain-containing protein [Robbsia sp. Bb-Pol-6]|uniref:Helix-turn-helix domain-containing protein n=1 Tax=Robbsia betulipollinis TaxID=2981849 RepID=A0ABT3ZHZ6_9BURK|nr:helix-turn-helix domain-containing protein [Robbsia betulipollinis]MCY0385982.1 helix-turn-helix domain-containing protein [Robbsia betulipollinis]